MVYQGQEQNDQEQDQEQVQDDQVLTLVARAKSNPPDEQTLKTFINQIDNFNTLAHTYHICMIYSKNSWQLFVDMLIPFTNVLTPLMFIMYYLPKIGRVICKINEKISNDTYKNLYAKFRYHTIDIVEGLYPGDGLRYMEFLKVFNFIGKDILFN